MNESIIKSATDLAQKLIGQSRYRIDIDTCSHFLDVLSFNAEESLSGLWFYDVSLTCDAHDISPETFLLKPASFTFQTPMFNGVPAIPVRTIFGVVQSFKRLSHSIDEARYSIRLVPRISLLQYTKRSEIYLNQSVIEVVDKVLRTHGFEGADFEFCLSQKYPQRELITQWRETDLEFVQRLLAEVGIFWRFEMDSKNKQDVIIFHDSQEHYQFGMRLPLRNVAGMNDNKIESVWDIHTNTKVVSKEVSTRDYNYREASTPQDSTERVNGIENITTGEVYHYAEPFLSQGDIDSPETGAYYAKMRHERLLNEQQTVTGKSNSLLLSPGQVLETDAELFSSLKDGIVITKIRSQGSRKQSFRVSFEGIPYNENVCYRPSLIKRPVISGSLPAFVESKEENDIYAWLDDTGRYRVKLNFDRNHTEHGYSYLWLRMAKPYAGDSYGFHSPLLDGTEVSIVFEGGDLDRPYIAYAQHDSQHMDHVTNDNHTRNIWRTPANNKLRMEDKRQEEHIKIATEYGKTQLNMGHLVDAQRKQRGTGFELRTDEYGAIRAARGLFLSANEQLKAQGPVLEMSTAIEQIKKANEEMQALNNAASQAQALTGDINAQLEMVNTRLDELKSAVLLASAPSGIALTSGEHLQMTSRRNTMINAGQHLDIGAMKNLSIAVEKDLGLFVHKKGAKLIANQGDVKIQAQHNTMDLFAKQKISVISTDDEIIISTPKKLTLNGGGSYLTLDQSGIEHGSSGSFIMKVANYLVPGGGSSLPVDTQDFKTTEININNDSPGKWISD